MRSKSEVNKVEEKLNNNKICKEIVIQNTLTIKNVKHIQMLRYEWIYICVCVIICAKTSNQNSMLNY